MATTHSSWFYLIKSSVKKCSSCIQLLSNTLELSIQKYHNTFNYYQNLIERQSSICQQTIMDRFGRKLPMSSVLIGFVTYAADCIAMALNPRWPVKTFYAPNHFVCEYSISPTLGSSSTWLLTVTWRTSQPSRSGRAG